MSVFQINIYKIPITLVSGKVLQGLIVFLKECFEKVNFDSQKMMIKATYTHVGKELKWYSKGSYRMPLHLGVI